MRALVTLTVSVVTACAALQVEGQVGIRGYALGKVPDRKCRARRHDGDGQGHERAHGASLV